MSKFRFLFKPRMNALIVVGLLQGPGLLCRAQNREEIDPQQIDQESEQEIKKIESDLETAVPYDRTEVTKFPKPKERIDFSKNEDIGTFKDVAVFQRTAMPKTHRVDLHGGLSFVPNDLFYNVYGLDAGLTYFFNETWGMELAGNFLQSESSKDLQDLEERQNVGVKNFISLKNYTGLHAIFSPVYGKVAVGNAIRTFEIFGTFGLGKVSTSNGSQSDAIEIGAGHLFSMSPSNFFRVDLKILLYKAKNIHDDDQDNQSFLVNFDFGRFLNRGKDM